VGQLNRDKLGKAVETLKVRVKGQDQAIDAVNQILVRAYTGLSGLQHSSKHTESVLFFVGPTGVGKTELAKALAQFLFGDDEACLRFDMSGSITSMLISAWSERLLATLAMKKGDSSHQCSEEAPILLASIRRDRKGAPADS
jgi:SpoVK/Ycf46/Vps4 family AAA+-type ATPase